ncbi:unnamed protein product [Camellia sinensis]
MKTDSETLLHSDQFVKPRRSKSRDVSSRYFSPSSIGPTESGIPSPDHSFSPLRQKPRSSTDSRKQRNLEDGGLIRGLWPSSTTSTTSTTTTTSSSNKKLGTLAEYLGNDRLKDLIIDDNKSNENSDNSMTFLNRQRSCSEFSRFEKDEQPRKSVKDNHKPLFGGSMRYAGKLRFPGRSSTSSSSNQSPALHDDIIPGRFSVDENALRRRSLGQRSSDSVLSDTQDSESECSDVCSGTSFGSSGTGKQSSKKSGIEVSSRYLSNRPRKGTSDSNIPIPASPENSPKNFSKIKNGVKRANSLTAYGSAKSNWALSPGRSGPLPMSVENKGKPMSFSSLRPPTSPSRAKGVGNLLSMGLDLFRSKKSPATSSSSSSSSSPSGCGMGESVHQLRLLQNRLVQWRYVNARADVVNEKMSNQAESNLIYACNSIAKLQHSVLQKKLQLEKEKLEMKLNFILYSQIKSLEAWGDMERQHSSAISMTKDCLHSVICRIPLVDGAKMETHSTSIALRHGSDLATSIKSMLSTFSPGAEKTVSMLLELAQIVAQEKALLEELLEHFRVLSTLEIYSRAEFKVHYNSNEFMETTTETTPPTGDRFMISFFFVHNL